MIDISLYNVSLDYGFGEILDKISLNIKYGEKVALIGDNGVGKSSIFKLITREETPTSGSISIRKNVTIGYLSQEELVLFNMIQKGMTLQRLYMMRILLPHLVR